MVAQKRKGRSLIHHEPLGPLLEGTVGAGHDLIARQGEEVREESGVDQRGKGRVPQKGNSEMCQCVHREMGGHWGEGSGVFQLSGITSGAGRVHRARWELDALALSRAGKDLQRRAGLRVVGEEISLRAAIRLL